jgi:hypothetical protein
MAQIFSYFVSLKFPVTNKIHVPSINRKFIKKLGIDN